MSTSKDKIQQFMESPLVAWVKTFDDTDTVDTVEDLADGILLNKVMNTVNPSNYNMSKVNRSVSNDPAARIQNLQLLVSRMKHFYLTDLQQLIIIPLPKIGDISADPRLDTSLDELEKLLVLLLGCVVQCEGRGPLIERMTTMDFMQQQALVVYIKEMTDTTNYVCSMDWNDLGEISRNNLEGLLRTAYLHLQRVAKERDGHFDVLLDTMIERDYYKQVFESTDGGNESLPRENGLALPSTPVRSPSMNTELLDLKKKSRLTQEQLDHKSLQLSEAKEELERALAAIHKLQQERQEMAAEAKAARMYRDEIETLKVQSAKVEKLEADVKKYRQKAEDTEYLRKRIADLKQQNELMLETKSLLEQKATSLTARADMVDDLQTDLASLRAQTESLTQEKEMSREKEEELMARVTHLELDNKHCQEQIDELTTMLEAEREKSDVGSTGEASNLSFEMTEADLASKAKVLRLEKEARELEKTTEALRQSQAKSAELEKANKKLYSQSHTDRKEIIKLREEVEVLRVKASRVDKLQVELNSLREKLEDSSRHQAKLKEFKTRSEAALQAKARLEDEVESLMTKLQPFNDVRDESASLKAQVESLTSKHGDDENRIQELLEQNAQLVLEKERSGEELAVLQGQLEVERCRSSSGSQTTVTVVSPPRLSEAEMASKAKVQRLEKERREMEKTIEGFRRSQAKLTELEKTNKKLQEQTHVDRREVIRLKEELQVYKTKAERLSSLQSAMRTQEHKLEDVDTAMKKITELKQQNALLSETKVLLQDEVSELHSRLERLNDVQAENSALKVRVESQETELKEEGQRMQTLLQQNVQLELDRDRKVAELDSMQAEMERLKRSQPPPNEVPFSPAGPLFSEQDIALQTKVLHLERDKRDLEQSVQLIRRSQERVEAENTSSKQKLTEQLHNYRKEVAKLKEELQRERAQLELLQLSRAKTSDTSQQDQKQAKQMQELESRFNEAYSQSLGMKDERIQVLEKRIEDLMADNEQLKDESSLLKRQNKRMQRKNSASNSPNTSFSRSYSPRELHRLREEAAKSRELEQAVGLLQQENHGLKADMDDARVYIERSEAANQRMQSRLQMLEQLNGTLEEEKKIMRDQLDRLMAQNQELLMKTLDTKDQVIMDERIFNDRLGELEKDKARLSEQLIAQQREHLVREMDILKKSKGKNLLKKGFKRLKGKIQGRSHTFEHGDLQSPSHMGLPPYAVHDGSMSSSQSISSSNSGRDVGSEPQEDGETPLESATAAAGQSGLIPRGPTSMETPPYIRKKRSNTMPSTVKLRHPPASSPQVMPEINEHLMSLEDFLAESDRTPNRRRVMELKRASLIINSPPMTPRNSLLLSAPHSASHTSGGGGGGERMFDLMQFLGTTANVRQSITEVDEGRDLQHQLAAEFQSQGSGMSSSQGLSQGLSQLSQHSDGGKSSVAELNTSLNSNTNNNNNDDTSVFYSSGGGGLVVPDDRGGRVRSESLMSMDEVLGEFDMSLATTFSQSETGYGLGGEPRPQPAATPTYESTTHTATSTAVSLSSSSLSPPLPLPTITTHHSSTTHLTSPEAELSSRNLSVQPQRQHSQSFNSGLNQLLVPSEPRPRSQTLSLAKSVSSDMLSGRRTAATAAKKKRKGKEKTTKGGAGSKKNKRQHTGSMEALSSGKPPLGRPRKNKLVLEPRGPLYGTDGGGTELRHHSALMVESRSSHLSQLTHIDRQYDNDTTELPPVSTTGETEGVGREEEERRVLDLQVAADRESLSLSDFLQRPLSPSSVEGEDAVVQEYGQI